MANQVNSVLPSRGRGGVPQVPFRLLSNGTAYVSRVTSSTVAGLRLVVAVVAAPFSVDTVAPAAPYDLRPAALRRRRSKQYCVGHFDGHYTFGIGINSGPIFMARERPSTI